jgi:hypothetical protein
MIHLRLFIFLFAVCLITPGLHAERTMATLPGVPVAGLRTYLPEAAYKKLINAPIKAWIVVRGQIIGLKISGARVVHSEGNGVYDKVSLRMANEMEVYTDMTASRIAPAVVVHIFVFQLPNGGEDAIGYAQDESLGASNFIYSRSLIMRHIGVPKQPKKK